MIQKGVSISPMSNEVRPLASILRAILASLLLTQLVACSGINPATLRKPSTPSELVLSNPVEWTYQTSSLRPVTFRGTISPGRYVAEYVGDEGTYFRGPPACFSYVAIAVSAKDQEGTLRTIVEAPCGLFVPKATTESKQLYIYLWKSRARAIGSTVSVPAMPGVRDSSAASSTTQLALNTPTASGSSIVGAGVAGVVIDAMVAAEAENLRIYHEQPPAEVLNASIRPAEATPPGSQ